jgi:alkaline phosphatase D
MPELPRRSLLRGGALGALTLGGVTSACSRTVTGGAPPAGPVFTLGVASGDPTPDGMVLWTRLAREPEHPDGLGGMPARAVEVEWELARDDRFARVVRRGTEYTRPEQGFAVHVEPTGLDPGREYWYRFRTGSELSPVGRTRTTPAAAALTPLTLCFASCARYDQGLFTAYRRLAEEHPDLVLHLGDYSYEYASSPKSVRALPGGEERTLADYRRRYAVYHADPDLQAAHQVAPWIAVFDDHEVENNWADLAPGHPREHDFARRREAAFQAYYENVPLRLSARPSGINMRLYRRLHWGALATFHMLDTRQFRDDQPCGDVFGSDCPDRTAPTRSLLGARQESWLADGFAHSGARWDLLGQQVMFSQLDLTPGLGRSYNPDAWDGYVACRDRVVGSWLRAGVRNPVVLSGDVHMHWAADIKPRFSDPAAPVAGSELVTTSISSEGDGSETGPQTAASLAENPHLKFGNKRRGYVRTVLRPESLTADFRVVPYVSRPGAPVETRASFVVADRRPGLTAT